MVSKMPSTPPSSSPSPPTSPCGGSATGAAAAGTATDKLCAVCGDRALGYNFNAVTCESCKAFFRRNALTTKALQCPFSERCDVTVVTRRFCQRCRLVKCFAAGMRKEYIMSEQDKLLKKIKIEQNRTKRKPSTAAATLLHDDGDDRVKKMMPARIERAVASLMRSDDDDYDDDDHCEANGVNDGVLNGGAATDAVDAASAVDTIMTTIQADGNDEQLASTTVLTHTVPTFGNHMNLLHGPVMAHHHISSSSEPAPPPVDDGVQGTAVVGIAPPMPTLDSSSTAIVDRLVNYPEDASKLINHLMKTPHDAVLVMTKIIHSQKDAMRLIGHLIGSPGDALKIISKIMNSPFDALTVFTKFMSSPTDALEIIAKIASSPSEVLQFIQQLMNSPEDALQIMNKFMNSPAEALKMLNKMVNNPTADSTTTMTSTMQSPPSLESVPPTNPTANHSTGAHPMIKSMLSDFSAVPATTWPATEQHSNSFASAANEKPAAANDADTIRDILTETMDAPIAANTLESVICDAISLEYDLGRSTTKTTTSSSSDAANRELNDAERAKLNELIVANKAMYAPLDEDLTAGLDECSGDSNRYPQDPQLLKIINLTAIAIRRLIKMSKKINAFRSMCQEDQVALLKGGCTEMMILRSAMQYDSTQAKWQVPNSQEAMSSITVDVLKLAKGNVYDVHETFIRTFQPKWRQDENIILILSAIVLFTPDRPRTVHADVLKLEQHSYYYLLRRYLESVYGGCEAKSTYLKLIQKIRDLQRLKDEFVGVYLDVNPKQVEPLLWEMFDMTNH